MNVTFSHFNPRSPCGERQNGDKPGNPVRLISIHAPRVGSDSFALNPMSPGSFISIHAPRVGSDRSELASNDANV